MAKIYGQNSKYLEDQHLIQSNGSFLQRIFSFGKPNPTYRIGQTGEWEVKAELNKLPDSYSVFCDVKLPSKSSNIDLVVTGPKGFFVLEVKNWEHVHHNSYFKSAVLQTQKNAIAVQNYLRLISDRKILVKGLLVFSNNKGWTVNLHSERFITFVNKQSLISYILSTPNIVYQREVQALEEKLKLFVQHNALARR